MSNKTIIQALLTLSITAIICMGCSSTKTAVNQSPEDIDITTEITTVESPTNTTSQNEEFIATGWTEYDKSQFPLLASLPKEGIGLYSIKGNGMVLKIHSMGFYFPWESTTPADVYPKIALNDYDSDGNKELAVILCSGHGTGVSLETLHILRLNGLEKSLYSNEHSFESNEVEPPKDDVYVYETVQKALSNNVKFIPVGDPKALQADISVDGVITHVDLKAFQNAEKTVVLESSNGLGDTINYKVDNDGIQIAIGIAMSAKNCTEPKPQYIGEIKGDVAYHEGVFKLKNLKFLPYEDFR